MKVDDYAFTLNSNQRIDEDEDDTETESTQIGRSQKSHKELSKDELNRKVSLNCSLIHKSLLLLLLLGVREIAWVNPATHVYGDKPRSMLD